MRSRGNQPERREVLYSGHVQGVGFRWTAKQVAQGFAVRGCVRNLDDGRVQLVAEGQPGELDRFLAALAERMQDYIHETRIAKAPATGVFPRWDLDLHSP